MKKKRRKGYYSISAVAGMLEVHQQTIRLYEKEGLITPQRTDGGTRIFTDEDVDKLEEIIHLTHGMGVNIAGVEMIMRLQRKVQKLQDDMNKLFESTQGQLSKESDVLRDEAKRKASSLLALKKTPLKAFPKSSAPEDKKETEETVDDDWEIEYDE